MLVWGIVLIVVAAVVISTFFGNKTANGPVVRTMTISPMTLSNTVSATGSVESSEDHKVYSTLGSLVSQVNVKVGDKVEAGDVLAVLDTETLELNIAQSEASINQAKSVAAQQIKQAEKNLNNAKKTLEEGLNSSVISAESGVDSAQIGQQNAALGLQSAEDNQEATQDMIGSYRDAYNDARADYRDAQDRYEEAKKNLDNATQGIPPSEYGTLTKALANVTDSYQRQLKEVEELGKKLEELKKDLNDAETQAEVAASAAEVDLSNEELQEASEKAQDRVFKAQENWDEMQAKYDEALAKANELYDEKTSIESQITALNVNSNIVNLTKELEAATQLKDSMEAAMLSARSRLESTRTQADSADNALDQAELAKKSADVSYETSLKQQQATLEGINQQIESYEDALTSSRIQADTTSQEISLQMLYKQLEDSTITAPISGVITAVNAEEGVPASGILFVIEDVDRLEISTSIKEYDIASVKEGLPVSIRTDAIDGEEFEGVLSEIAPTGSKGASGSGVTFAAKVSIPKPGALRVGMNTRMDIILEEKENVFSVPFDALHTAEDGSNYIISVVANESEEKGALPFVTKNIPVTTGLETDFYVEIISDQLTEGMQIIPTNDEYAEGTPVQVM